MAKSPPVIVPPKAKPVVAFLLAVIAVMSQSGCVTHVYRGEPTTAVTPSGKTA